MNNRITKKKERKYYIDWLRILLILSVFIYHIGMVFNTWNWHIKNDEEIKWFGPIMVFLHLWRMPLLFLVSGVGTFYALRSRTVKQYLKERTIRIFIPFIIGVFTLVPIQVYIEKINDYNSLLQFYHHMFDGIYPKGNFSLHHLWFLLYLFLIALIISPFLNSLRSDTFLKIRDRIILKSSKKLGLNWIIIVLALSQLILRNYLTEKSTNMLYNDWAYFVYYFLFFLAGFVLISSDKLVDFLSRQRHLYLIQTLIFTTFMIVIKYFNTDTILIDYLYGLVGVIVTWSCAITVLGYAKKYLNKDSKYRKIANEAIYPFYLLQQPVIIIVGYFIVQGQIDVYLKILYLTLISFFFVISIYWLLIRPFYILRVAFGLRALKEEKGLLSNNNKN